MPPSGCGAYLCRDLHIELRLCGRRTCRKRHRLGLDGFADFSVPAYWELRSSYVGACTDHPVLAQHRPEHAWKARNLGPLARDLILRVRTWFQAGVEVLG